MATISTTITHGIALGTSGAYASPLTITASGYIDDAAGGDAIVGPNTQSWTVVNDGRVASLGTAGEAGIQLGDGGVVTNSGTITGAVDGIFIVNASGTVGNTGTIVGSGRAGVALNDGGVVVNNSPGVIAGVAFGIYVNTAAGTVVNSGAITASGTFGTAVHLAAGGVVTNASTGVISSGFFGVRATAAASIGNYGSVSADGFGIFLGLGGSVGNAAGAVILGGDAGVYAGSAAAATISNSGSIGATGTAGRGVVLAGGGSVVNSATGSVSGAAFGIYTKGAAGTLSNDGSITGATGANFSLGGTVRNGASGVIVGESSGVTGLGAALTLNNYGTIVSTDPAFGFGAALQAGGTIINHVGGFIGGTGEGSGIYVTGAVGAVVNFGSVIGNTGVYSTYHTTVTNYGRFQATEYAAVGFRATGLAVNMPGGLLVGAYGGIYFNLFFGTVVNSGSIYSIDGPHANGVAGYGIFFTDGGLVTNNASGYISADNGAIYSRGTAGTVFNSGTLTASYGIGFAAGGIVSNDVSGMIIGGRSGIISDGAALTLTNSGTILGTSTTTVSTGANLWFGGRLINNAGALISGSTYGVYVKGAAGTLTNAGSIAGGRALDIRAGGYLVNTASGSISGVGQGVQFNAVAGTLINSGRITATATDGVGVYLVSGGAITNNAAAVISGGAGGVLIAGAAGTLITAGTISGGTYAVKFANSAANLLVIDPGAVFVGTITGGGGTDTLELDGSTGNPLTVNYNNLGLKNFEDVLFGAGNHATLQVSNKSGTLGVTISGLDATTEAIDLTGIGGNGQITNNDIVNHRVTITGSLGSVTLQLDASDGTVFATAPDGGGGTNFTIACFCRGTLILTPSGEVPVEDLVIGDRVVTLSGRTRPIKWIGRRAYDTRFVRGNRNILPVRVMAGALAAGLPARDLFISPEHALYLDGLFLPARDLVNGATIRQDSRSGDIEYFHIELDSHDVIFAEGAAAETFVAFGGRGMFHNGVEFAALYPDNEPPEWEPYEAMLERGLAGLPRIRAALLTRAERLGRLSRDPDLHLRVDGVAVRAHSVENNVHRFAVPAGAGDVRLASRSMVPAETEISSLDQRRLGVPVQRIVLRGGGRSIEMGPDCPELRRGFHADEGSHRWADGDAVLPPALLSAIADDLIIEVQIVASELRYPVDVAADAASGRAGQKSGQPRRRGIREEFRSGPAPASRRSSPAPRPGSSPTVPAAGRSAR